MAANKVAEEITRAAGRLQYAIDTTALVFPDTWDGESECLAVYWSSAVGHARPHAKAPFLSGWDPTKQLWGHGGHWPLLAILTAPGAKRIRTREGQEKQRQRQLRRRVENPQKKWRNQGWAPQPRTEERAGWSQEDRSVHDWRGQEADEERWHSAEEGDSDEDEGSQGDWHSDRRVSFRARDSVARESAAGAGNSTDPILVPPPPPPPTGPPPRQRTPPTPDGAADRPYYKANPVITFTRRPGAVLTPAEGLVLPMEERIPTVGWARRVAERERERR